METWQCDIRRTAAFLMRDGASPGSAFRECLLLSAHVEPRASVLSETGLGRLCVRDHARGRSVLAANVDLQAERSSSVDTCRSIPFPSLFRGTRS